MSTIEAGVIARLEQAVWSWYFLYWELYRRTDVSHFKQAYADERSGFKTKTKRTPPEEKYDETKSKQ